jgi:hypothetical protein
LVHTPAHTVRPALHDATHSPAVHALPGGHARPQLPQCASSVSRSRHDAPHADCPVGQESWQARATQISPAAQALPHEPQLRRSVRASAQYSAAPPSPLPPPQVASEASQEVAQRPRLHTWPAGHAVSHAPQWVTSVWSVTHCPPHTDCVTGHCTWQPPATHTMPAPHAAPHDPQCAGSTASVVHRPPHAT